MNNVLKIFLFIFFCIISQISVADDKQTYKTIIKGIFTSPDVNGKPITLYYASEYFGISSLPLRGNKLKAKIKDQTFEFEFSEQAPYLYFLLEYVDGSDANYALKYPERLKVNYKTLLIKSGASIVINISDKSGISISGKDAELIDCQFKLDSISSNTFKAGIKKNKQPSPYEKLLTLANHYEDIYNRQRSYLQNNCTKIDSFSKEVIKLDCYFALEDRLMSVSRSIFDNTADVQKKNKDKLKFYIDHFLFSTYPIESTEKAALFSRQYVDFLIKKQIRDMDILMEVTSLWVRPTFGQLYDKMSQAYTGTLREKILTGYFLNQFVLSEAPEYYLDLALKLFKIPEYRTIIQDIKKSRGTGEPAFNFSLTDTTGNNVTLQMLKGKLLVLDFWFSGCGGCAYLNEKMSPVYEYYKGNPNIQFVSISTDKKVETWKNSVKSGVYSHTGSLNLFTDGLSREHPIIKHYDIYAYPTLILIDKNGNIITSSPPHPRTPEAAERFISLIDRNLN